MSVGTSFKKRPLFEIELRRCLINYKSGGREKKQLFWRSPGMVLSTMSIQAVRRMLLAIGDDDTAAEVDDVHNGLHRISAHHESTITSTH